MLAPVAILIITFCLVDVLFSVHGHIARRSVGVMLAERIVVLSVRHSIQFSLRPELHGIDLLVPIGLLGYITTHIHIHTIRIYLYTYIWIGMKNHGMGIKY